jgi:hypothetical protein
MGALRACQYLSVIAIQKRRGGCVALTTRPVEPTTAVEVILWKLLKLLRLKEKVYMFNKVRRIGRYL